MEKIEATILIVDDDTEILRSLNIFLGRYFTSVISEQDPKRIAVTLNNNGVDVVLLDMNFNRGIRSGEEGFRWLKKIKEVSPDIEVVMITAFGDVEMAIRAIKEGAQDFIMKPWVNEKLLATVMAALRQSKSNRVLGKMKLVQKQLLERKSQDGFMNESRSEAVKRMLDVAKKVANSDANVLILGENGSGKENVAETIHSLSERRNSALIKVDLGSINENLFESELFGHVKGAFTDSKDDKVGRIELASEGTLFLDEIANLPLNMQSKLLTILQSRKVIRVGASRETKVNFRLICATNRNLIEMVEKGTFREDLLYRINTVEINVPPLRQRITDIPLFLDHFLEFYSNRYGKPGISYDKKLIDIMMSYKWPGNIRELKHAVERAVILSEGKKITRVDFPIFDKGKYSGKKDGSRLDDIEMNHIMELLRKNEGHITKTASDLGISRYTLHRKIKRYEI
jgi:DNA-binding NtrC family response regulator